ncbi:hypothetical protein O181_027969 [Austropuccinia psidii MF-1]|uniref:Trafficking protein particle complex subunit 13 n=1 Tax=Austropuccinia psidii MF-1 TaxID=1389203 RepID=A0A9Q3CPV5_9BASI|nr:hypothetical protein [Austropuccinia psidii MF-1]
MGGPFIYALFCRARFRSQHANPHLAGAVLSSSTTKSRTPWSRLIMNSIIAPSQTQQHPPSHPLSLKVLRSSRPTLAHLNPSNDDLNSHFTSNALILPNSIGTIYLGENFIGILSLQIEKLNHQTKSLEIKKPNLLVEIQSNESKNSFVLGSIQADNLISKDFNDPDQQSKLNNLNHSLELVVKHELNELGLHTLICTVTYEQEVDLKTSLPPSKFHYNQVPNQSHSPESADPSSLNSASLNPYLSHSIPTIVKSFKKLYKFHVLSPLSVKTKIFSPTLHHSLTLPSTINASLPRIKQNIDPISSFQVDVNDLDDGNQKSFLEVQIQNQSSQEMVFEQIKLEIDHQILHRESQNPLIIEDFHSNECNPATTKIRPGDIRQFLFKIDRKQRKDLQSSHKTQDQEKIESKKENQIKKEAGQEPIGRLEFKWNSLMGEPARLRTSTLSKMISLQDSCLEWIHRPSSVKLGKPFKVSFKLPDIFDSSRSICPILPTSSHGRLLILGPSKVLSLQQLPNLFEINYLAIQTGLIDLGKISTGNQVTDHLLNLPLHSIGFVWCSDHP